MAVRCISCPAVADQVFWRDLQCAEFKKIRRGGCLRGETFWQELLEQAHQRTGSSRIAKLKVEPEAQMNLISHKTKLGLTPLWAGDHDDQFPFNTSTNPQDDGWLNFFEHFSPELSKLSKHANDALASFTIRAGKLSADTT